VLSLKTKPKAEPFPAPGQSQVDEKSDIFALCKSIFLLLCPFGSCLTDWASEPLLFASAKGRIEFLRTSRHPGELQEVLQGFSRKRWAATGPKETLSP
jgi:hypothetical protein